MDIKWFSFNKNNFDIYGISEEDYHRLPMDVAMSAHPDVADKAKSSAGGRIRFITNSEQIYVKAIMKSAGSVGFDLFRFEQNKEIFVGEFKKEPCFICEGLFEGSVDSSNDKKMQSYTLNFPYSGEIEKFELGINADAVLMKGNEYRNELPIAFYGSSITQGFKTSRPGNTYEALISQKYNINYLNFGFAGSARGEQSLIEYIASLDICAFVCDYDHNAYDFELLKSTHLKVYQTVRKYKPNIPYIIITRPDYWTAIYDNDKRTALIYKTYLYAKNMGDNNVYFIDGKTLFEGEFCHNCTKDGCHPNDLGAFRMAQKIGQVIAMALNIETETEHDKSF